MPVPDISPVVVGCTLRTVAAADYQLSRTIQAKMNILQTSMESHYMWHIAARASLTL